MSDDTETLFPCLLLLLLPRRAEPRRKAGINWTEANIELWTAFAVRLAAS
jgi:hypothetical protein